MAKKRVNITITEETQERSDDLCRMVDSSAFNDIIRAYLKMAVQSADIDEDAREKVVGQLRWLFDEKTAKQVLEGR